MTIDPDDLSPASRRGSPAVFRGTVVAFDAATYTAQVMLEGQLSEVELHVAEWVPKSQLAADDEVAVILFDPTNPEDGLVLGAYGAAADLLAVTGIPANGQVPIGNGSGFTLAAIAGTANQVTVTNGAGAITLGLPQTIHTAATPTFGGLYLGSGQLNLVNNYLQGFQESALANGATLNLGGFRGLILVSNVTDGGVELVAVTYTGTAVSLGGNGLAMNLNSDAGATLALYVAGGLWTLKNRYGSSKAIRVQVIGN